MSPVDVLPTEGREAIREGGKEEEGDEEHETERDQHQVVETASNDRPTRGRREGCTGRRENTEVDVVNTLYVYLVLTSSWSQVQCRLQVGSSAEISTM